VSLADSPLSSSLSESLKCAIIVHKSHKLFSVCVCFRCAFSVPPRPRKKELMYSVKMYFYGGNTNRNLAPKNSTVPAYSLFFLSLSFLAMRSRSAASTASLSLRKKVFWQDRRNVANCIHIYLSHCEQRPPPLHTTALHHIKIKKNVQLVHDRGDYLSSSSPDRGSAVTVSWEWIFSRSIAVNEFPFAQKSERCFTRI
jgi:hypothetical protein